MIKPEPKFVHFCLKQYIKFNFSVQLKQGNVGLVDMLFACLSPDQVFKSEEDTFSYFMYFACFNITDVQKHTEKVTLLSYDMLFLES